MSNLGTPIDASGKMEKFSAQDRVSPGPFDSTILRSTNSLSGMHGTFLDLCPSSSRTTMLPGKNPNGYNPTSTFQIINEELTYKYGANAVHVTPDSPSRLVVDDSGYASSESSLYDVDSDDEDGALGFQDENNIEGHNLAGSSECPVNKICNAREQVPSTINQGDANPVEDCPCINGNPFMHVMTQVTEDTVQTVAWKKRSIL
ncbi:uncharacterized protein LOC110431437 [Sorghum bicolor]|uniref:uncharacterized protein LOC110431437 n=1 Tax=Sorghum bicolor TaxID=4558 RepID=UPI000B424DDD|nr:uncharacterized protein LOC110431437 [Sorghum bicolor]|eukprot:XP_021306253.1 uncharacterized protein LOC110431437 [Sorghum bicolor]